MAWQMALSSRPKRTRALVRPGVRTGMKHVKGIEYNGVGWLMTTSVCGDWGVGDGVHRTHKGDTEMDRLSLINHVKRSFQDAI